MKAYVSDTEDLKQDPMYQETWDDMIINVRTIDLWIVQLFLPVSLLSTIAKLWLKFHVLLYKPLCMTDTPKSYKIF